MNLEDYRQREISKSKYKSGQKVLIHQPHKKNVITVLIEAVNACSIRGCVVGFDVYYFCKDLSGKRISFVQEKNIKRGA